MVSVVTGGNDEKLFRVDGLTQREAWQPLDTAPIPAVDIALDVPYVTHEGYLTIRAARLRLLRMSDGPHWRVIDGPTS